MVHYQEKLTPSPWLILALSLIVPSALVMFIALGMPWLGLILGVVIFATLVVLIWGSSPKIVLDENYLTVGSAKIELEYIGEISSFEKEAAFEQRGPAADARTWMRLTPGIDPVVKLQITDPKDPTPFWLFSSRNPELLKEKLSELVKTNH